MKTMLIASSALALVAAPSFAQDPAYDPATTQQPATGDQRTDHRANDGLFDDWFDDGHSLEGTSVYTNDGERVGSVERVRGGAGSDAYTDLTDGTTRDLDVTGLVVETGGFLGIGTREVDIEAGNAQRTSVDGEQRIILDMSNAEFERLREHARDADRRDDTWRDNQRQDTGQRADDRGGLIPASDTQTGVQGQVGHDRGAFATDDAFRDDHPLRDVAVYTNDGERVGSVERVRGGGEFGTYTDMTDGDTSDLDVSGLVIETGGFLGIGTREVDVDAGNAQRTSVDGEQRIILDMSNAEFERLREHARDDDDMWGTDDRADRTWQDRQDGAATQTDADMQTRTGAGTEGQTRAQTQAETGVTGQTQAGQVTQQAGVSGQVGGVYTDDHDWVDAPVFSSDGERVGRVRQVRSAGGAGAMAGADSDVAAIIVRTGGFLGIGSREVEVDARHVRTETQQGDPRLVLDMTEDRFGELPAHDRNRSNRAGG